MVLYTNKKIGAAGMTALWLGAAISLAEILTGGLLAPLGMKQGILVILLGHLIGTLVLAAVGVIGYREKRTAMETVQLALGKRGGDMVGLLNCLQLLGWTSIMLIQCARALGAISEQLVGFNHAGLLTVLGGGAVLLWALWEYQGKRLVNTVAVVLLLGLSVVMGWCVWKYTPTGMSITEQMTLGMGFELSVVMPLSWIPLVADYTCRARSEKVSFWGTFGGYLLGSCFMYIIGLTAAVHAGTADPIQIMLKLKLGLAALLIVLLSTLTTTFLDVYSAAMSACSISKRWPPRYWIVFFCILGTGLALYFPMEKYEFFLYWIGSVFAPVFAVVLVDYFCLRARHDDERFNSWGILATLLGVVAYYQMARLELPLGVSLPTMVFTGMIYLAGHLLLGKIFASRSTEMSAERTSVFK